MAVRGDLVSQDPALQGAFDNVSNAFTRNVAVRTFSMHLTTLVESVVGKSFDKAFDVATTMVTAPTSRGNATSASASSTAIATIALEIFRNGLESMRGWTAEHWNAEALNWALTYTTVIPDFAGVVGAYVGAHYINSYESKHIDIQVRYPKIHEFLMYFFNTLISQRDVRSGIYFRGNDMGRAVTFTKVFEQTLYEFMFTRKYIVKLDISEMASTTCNPAMNNSDSNTTSTRHQEEEVGESEDDRIKRLTENNLERCKPTESDAQPSSQFQEALESFNLANAVFDDDDGHTSTVAINTYDEHDVAHQMDEKMYDTDEEIVRANSHSPIATTTGTDGGRPTETTSPTSSSVGQGSVVSSQVRPNHPVPANTHTPSPVPSRLSFMNPFTESLAPSRMSPQTFIEDAEVSFSSPVPNRTVVSMESTGGQSFHGESPVRPEPRQHQQRTSPTVSASPTTSTLSISNSKARRSHHTNLATKPDAAETSSPTAGSFTFHTPKSAVRITAHTAANNVNQTGSSAHRINQVPIGGMMSGTGGSAVKERMLSLLRGGRTSSPLSNRHNIYNGVGSHVDVPPGDAQAVMDDLLSIFDPDDIGDSASRLSFKSTESKGASSTTSKSSISKEMLAALGEASERETIENWLRASPVVLNGAPILGEMSFASQANIEHKHEPEPSVHPSSFVGDNPEFVVEDDVV